MQQSLIFWRNWPPLEKALAWGLMIVVGVVSIGVLVGHLRGLENVVNWDILSELDEIPVALEQYHDQVLLGKAFIVKEQFVPSLMTLPPWLSMVYVVLVGLGLALILAAVSGLPQRYYVGIICAMFVLFASFQFEIMLSLGGKYNLIGWALVLGGLSYYFNAFGTSVQMPSRVGYMLLAAVLLGGGTLYFSKTNEPVLTLASFSVLGVTLLSVLFIGWLAVEVIGAFVYVTTNERTGFGKRSLYNFLFISGLYLLSLVLIYLKNTRRIEGDFWLLSPFWWLLACVWLGWWSFQKRTAEAFSFRHIGFWLYGGGALLLLATMGFAFFTNNNPLIETLEDSFLYSQMAMGLTFILYIGLNFWPLFNQGKAVHKVMFKPMRVAQQPVWIAGILLAAGLAALDGFFTVRQGWAGYQNALGDLYAQTAEYRLAEQYYKLALAQDYQNHKSNYALASLALKQNDRTTAGYYFNQALLKNPSPQDYAALSKTLLDENLFFDAIFNLRKGIKTFGKSGELQNNLGYLYARTSIADSAFYYLDWAQKNTAKNQVPQANLMAFWAKNPRLIPEGQVFEPSRYASAEANRYAVAWASRKKPIEQPLYLETTIDSALSVNNFAYFFNYAQQGKNRKILQKIAQNFIKKSENSPFYDDLQLVQAYTNYDTNKLVAFDILTAQTAIDTSQKTAISRATMYFWLMKEALEDTRLRLPARFTKADEATRFSRQHPLSVRVLRLAVAYWNQHNQPEQAYEVLLAALRHKKDSPDILKLYIKQCLQMNYSEFAEDALLDLKNIDNVADYQMFVKEYNIIKRHKSVAY